MEQITINYDAGPVESYETCREYIASLVHDQGRPHKAIAADMDYSPSDLTRKLAQSPGDTRRFNLDDLEKFVEATGDTRPILYLVEKYLAGPKTREALQRELERIQRQLGAVQQ